MGGNTEAAKEKFKFTWIHCKIVLIVLIFFYLVLSSFLTHGIQVTVESLWDDYMDHARTSWRFYSTHITGLLLQCWLCVCIENLLYKQKISTKLSYILHAINALTLLHCSCLYFYYNRNHPGMAFYMVGLVVNTVYKYSSFVLWHSNFRKKIQKKSEKSSTIPDAFKPNFYHLCYFMATSSIEYDPKRIKPSGEPIDFLKIFQKFCEFSFVVFFIWIIGKQVLRPELDKAIVLCNEREYLRAASVLLKNSLLTEILWYLAFYWSCYQVIFYIMEEVTTYSKPGGYCLDWWESDSIYEFWRRWNSWFSEFITNNLYVPLLRKGYTPRVCTFAVFLLSAILHEYMVSIPLGIFNGGCFLGMLVQMPLGEVTQLVRKKFGSRCGNLVTVTIIILGHTFGSFVLYKDYVNSFA